jgi:hypothetical protein
MAAVLPRRDTRAIGRTASVVILCASFAGTLALWLVLRPAGPPADLRVQPIASSDISVVNAANVTVAVVVTNHGGGPVTPTCQVDAGSADGSHHGAGQFNLAEPLGPGHSRRFTVELVISGLGAAAVTQASAHCH